MEKADRVAVIRGAFDWSDVGSWQAVSELTEPDAAGNRGQGERVSIGTRDTFVHAGDRVVATVGVDNLVIVDTPDAVLVAHRDHLQRVQRGRRRAEGARPRRLQAAPDRRAGRGAHTRCCRRGPDSRSSASRSARAVAVAAAPPSSRRALGRRQRRSASHQRRSRLSGSCQRVDFHSDRNAAPPRQPARRAADHDRSAVWRLPGRRRHRPLRRSVRPRRTLRSPSPASSPPPFVPLPSLLPAVPLPGRKAIAQPFAGSADALALSQAATEAAQRRQLVAVVCADALAAQRLAEEIAWFAPASSSRSCPTGRRCPTTISRRIRTWCRSGWRRSTACRAATAMW